MKSPARVILASLLGGLALASASCSDEDSGASAEKGVTVEMVGARAAAQAEYVREIVTIFVIHCAGLRQYWPAVRSAKADLVEGNEIRRDIRRGWEKEVRLEIVTKPNGLPVRYGYASGKTLVYFLGLGREPGVVSADVDGQRLCKMPVNKFFDSYLPIPALNDAEQKDGA